MTVSNEEILARAIHALADALDIKVDRDLITAEEAERILAKWRTPEPRWPDGWWVVMMGHQGKVLGCYQVGESQQECVEFAQAAYGTVIACPAGQLPTREQFAEAMRKENDR